MTVAELIELLRKFPLDMDVYTNDTGEPMPIDEVNQKTISHSHTGPADNMDVWEETEEVVVIE